jgi:hypothetical protein
MEFWITHFEPIKKEIRQQTTVINSLDERSYGNEFTYMSATIDKETEQVVVGGGGSVNQGMERLKIYLF